MTLQKQITSLALFKFIFFGDLLSKEEALSLLEQDQGETQSYSLYELENQIFQKARLIVFSPFVSFFPFHLSG